MAASLRECIVEDHMHIGFNGWAAERRSVPMTYPEQWELFPASSLVEDFQVSSTGDAVPVPGTPLVKTKLSRSVRV